MQHEMHLAKNPFEKIRNRTKTIESRLFDDKRKLINHGDVILFRQSDDESQEVKTEVIAVLRYDSFNDLMTAFPPAMFGGNSTGELLTEIRQFYSEHDEKKYGVVGIKIVRI